MLCPFYYECPIKSPLHPIDYVDRVVLITETISQTQKHEIQINLVKGKYEENISKQLRKMIYSGVGMYDAIIIPHPHYDFSLYFKGMPI